MIECSIPQGRDLRLQYLVCDFNGTLATDGKLIPQVGSALRALKEKLRVVVVTADTYGSAQRETKKLGVTVEVLEGVTKEDQGNAEAKRKLIAELGADRVAAIGNGHNDRLMLSAAALSVAVLGVEGGAMTACLAADVVCHNIQDALNLLLFPNRLRATLRG